MNNNLENPFYYLENFRFVLAWVLARYADLLTQDEVNFVSKFSEIPIESQALLVRMVMRRGNLFRASKLRYQEIGAVTCAVQPLMVHGWITNDPVLTFEQLYVILTKNEFALALQLNQDKGVKKADLLDQAKTRFIEPCRFSEWCTDLDDMLYEVDVAGLCDRIRLMFFGNLYQDWSEFVLADLGIFIYEKVPFPEAARAFHERGDIDVCLHLHACRERLQEGGAVAELENEVGAVACPNPWLQNSREKLLFQIGQQYERLDDNVSALRVYTRCHYAGARLRHIRVLEKLGQLDAANTLANIALANPESAKESQHLARTAPRLQRKLGQKPPRIKIKMLYEQIELVLPRPQGESVEEVARCHIESLVVPGDNAPVHYVENTLINSLFGLLCWEAIFFPVPGAFFHPFQIGPADLHSPNFRAQRTTQFDQFLSQLSSQQYQHTIRETFFRKSGIQSPFVYWNMLSEDLLEQALTCIPASHLEKFFARILEGIVSNRSGFPDLIQFWPRQCRYRMIEVKGPGDRLQDNQIRFLDFCAQHQVPVAVCYVEWEPESA
jgi:hypothetical protein